MFFMIVNRDNRIALLGRKGILYGCDLLSFRGTKRAIAEKRDFRGGGVPDCRQLISGWEIRISKSKSRWQ